MSNFLAALAKTALEATSTGLDAYGIGKEQPKRGKPGCTPCAIRARAEAMKVYGKRP